VVAAWFIADIDDPDRGFAIYIDRFQLSFRTKNE